MLTLRQRATTTDAIWGARARMFGFSVLDASDSAMPWA
jgi:hypothetical protein